MRFSQVLCGTASAVVLAGLGATSVAQAQEADTQTVDSIIVTAQKREQNLQDVPVVVTAVGAKLLQDTGVKDIKDLTILTPGLTVTSTSSEASTTARVRGVGTLCLMSACVVRNLSPQMRATWAVLTVGMPASLRACNAYSARE